MFWKKKKEGVLPELPPLRILSRSPRSLPSFPEYPKMKEEIEMPELPEFPKYENRKTIEMQEWVPEEEMLEVPSPPEDFENMKPKTYVGHHPREEKKSEIYIKIDRFRTARRDLQVANEKLEEIDHLLRKIRETKMREEQELAAWEKEAATVKSRIQSVTENIFERIE